jgi:hypothetical protein
MPGYIGTPLIIQWSYGTGTTLLNGDYLSFNYTPSVDLVDETAGADTNKVYLAAQKDGKASASGNFQTGSGGNGTAMGTVLQEGYFGTIAWSPEGTAAGKARYSMPAYSQGVKFDYAYADLTKWACDWQQSGTRVEGTN